MNIKERQGLILQSLEAYRFGHVDHSKDIVAVEKFEPVRFDWNKLVKPPITSLLHPKVIDDMHNLVQDVRLMSDPVKKYKYMNQILAPMRFCPAASGTNRRAFYCEYDPTIILKIGSDRVGRADNISEYYTQQILKPFCTKIYDVLPSGVIQLCERVEPMTEYDFKHQWAGEIFDLIMNLLYRGYMLEDIGGNFYKNWAVRLGFGPVLIDFPYVYEVDWAKLHCVYVDPRTKQKCDGELDYDYSKGMSEIVCEKCGSRYSANYLAKNGAAIQASQFRREKSKMRTGKFQVKLVRGNQVVYTSQKEVSMATDFVVAKPVAETTQPVKAEAPVAVQQEAPREFVADLSQKGKHKSFAPKIQVGTIRVPKKGAPPRKNDNNQSRPFPQREPINESLLPDVTEFLDHINAKFGRGAVIDLSRRLGLYWKTKEERNGGLLEYINRDKAKERDAKNESKETMVQRTANSKGNTTKEQTGATTQVQKGSAPESAGDGVQEASEGGAVAENNNNQVTDHQTTGLFPVKPMTADEIEAADLATRTDTAAMGFPGEPVVNTMRQAQSIPLLKKRVEDNLNGFASFNDPTKNAQYLVEEIKKLVSSEIAHITGTDEAGIEIMVNESVDHMNKQCFAVKIENRKSPIFETVIYPSTTIDASDPSANIHERTIAEGINLLDTAPNPNQVKTAEGEMIDFNDKDLNEFCAEIVSENLVEMQKEGSAINQKAFMTQKLFAALLDGGMLPGAANRKAYGYVDENYPFTQNEL